MATVPHEIVRVGPWGEGRSGVVWDDVVDDGVVYSGIRRIRVSYDRVGIRSIHIEYDNNGSTVSRKHGRSHHDKEIQLDYPREILTSISGCYGTCITSLTFERNWNSNNTRTLGSRHEGTDEFSSPNGDVKIVGFHGRSDDEYLRSIGVYYLSDLHAAVPPQSFKTIVFGQLEGEAGYKWDDKVYSGIRQIIVIYGNDAIDSIHIEYDNNGSTVWKEHGGSGGNRIPLERGVKAGNKIGKIRLRYPHEILTSISGHHDTYLRSLTFESNLKEYGPYGIQRENNFKSPIGPWKIVGFHGRSGSHFYCIGVSLSCFPESVKPISVGVWGGQGGNMWDDGVYSGIHQIIIVYDKKASAITSIDIQYDNNGSSFWLEHGGNMGNKIKKIQLEYPNESLTSISGSYGPYGIRRLTFKSKSRKYGPYGIQGGGTHDFSFPNEDSFPNGDVKIVGFYGRSDEYLRSIGVYYLPNLQTAVSAKEYPPEGETSFNPRVGRKYRGQDEGAYALIKDESLYPSAKKAQEAERKKKGGGGSRAREEGGGSRACEEEEGKEEKEAEGSARYLSSLHI